MTVSEAPSCRCRHLRPGVHSPLLARAVRRYVADPYSTCSLSSRTRAHRWEMLLTWFPKLRDMTVLDLGGTPRFWSAAPVRPQRVVTVNLEDEDDAGLNWVMPVTGDACDLPTAVRRDRFDLVFSNSLIEHVGGHERRKQFAAQVHMIAERHWIQSPYRYFPVEPHWVFPWHQHLPVATRAWVSRRWPLGHIRSSPNRAVADALSVELLSKTEMRYYFPDSQLLEERVVGITKSLVAARSDVDVNRP
jgi:hypothetical protein